MYLVSPQYNEQNFRQVRNASHVKIAFGVVDPQGAILSAPADNGHLPFSAVDRIDMGVGVSQTYQTLEHNRFILDGRNALAQYIDFLYQGYVGSEISGADGVWTNPPTVTINFEAYTQFSALTFNFDTTMDEYPTDLQITAYHDANIVSDELVHPNTAENWIYNTQLPSLNKLVIKFIKSRRPYRRARILALLWGFTQVLTENDISDCSMKHSIDMLSASLPQFSFSFTMLDQEKRYDPESPDTLWDYLESLQPVNVQLGTELDDGSIEWIPLCNLHTTGDVSVGAQGVVTEVTFQTKSLLQHLDTPFNHGLWRPNNPISLYDLAQEVIATVEYDKTVIFDNVLKNIYTSSPLPIKSVAECLQMIANAGQCVLDVNRNGAITITPYQTNATNFELLFDSMKEPPATSKVPPLRDVITSYTSFVSDDEAAKLAEVTLQDASKKRITVKHQAAHKQSIVPAEQYTLKNMVNGNFEVDTSGWTTTGSGEVISASTDFAYYGTKSLKSVSGAASVYFGPNHNPWSKMNYTHKYYFLTRVYVTTLTNNSWYTEIGRTVGTTNTYVSLGNSTVTNQWVKQTYYIDWLTADVTNFWLAPLRFRNTGAAGDTGYCDSVLFVDLTEAFGEGNEPSKEWCDQHLDWFDGTIKITKDSYVVNNLVAGGNMNQGVPLGFNNNAAFGKDTANGVDGQYIVAGAKEIYSTRDFRGNAGDKFYIYAQTFPSNASASSVVVDSLQGNQHGVWNIPSPSPYYTWYKKTGVFQITANELTFRMLLGTSYANNVDCTTCIDNVMLINLTESFGAGNEPTKEWCDQHLNWFDGTAVTQSIAITDPNYYTYATEFTADGINANATQSYIINGIPISDSTTDVVKRYNDLGSDCSVENVLVDSYAKASAYADWVAGINMRRNDYVIPNRGFAELDIQDDITIETNFESKVLATVTSNEISYNGAVSGNSKCMIVKKG